MLINNFSLTTNTTTTTTTTTTSSSSSSSSSNGSLPPSLSLKVCISCKCIGTYLSIVK
ncbi:unnamed protein product [Schistosoma mattheei]|uniref:Uncharacterized protein n=1 Tax=Schistosoma mattheei TaxID=31246 RepID=A0A183NQV7_9TREM|nr:unnamed protein product [Schistosoma mattheei]